MMHSERRAQLITVGGQMAVRDGIRVVTQESIAVEAGVSRTLVNAMFGGMGHYWNAVMEDAVKRRDVELLAQGLALGVPAAQSAPRRLRAAAAKVLAGVAA